MKRWVVATLNPGKVAEIHAILAGRNVTLESLSRHATVAFPDEGLDYQHNALAKARAAAEQLGVPAVADDSGLEVDALDGRPGPLSARYGGAGLDDAGRIAKLLAELELVSEADRGARFVCMAALATPSGEQLWARGECRGRILPAARGSGGFGYDPVFQLEAREETMSQIAREEKTASLTAPEPSMRSGTAGIAERSTPAARRGGPSRRCAGP